jgi:hypothetical protein
MCARKLPGGIWIYCCGFGGGSDSGSFSPAASSVEMIYTLNFIRSTRGVHEIFREILGKIVPLLH